MNCSSVDQKFEIVVTLYVNSTCFSNYIIVCDKPFIESLFTAYK